MSANFESGIFTISPPYGVSKIDAKSGSFVINTGTGDTKVITGEGTYTIYTGSGKATINTGPGVNIIKTGYGLTTVNTGSGYSAITTGTGQCIINTGSDLGTTKITLGSGLTIINGKRYFGCTGLNLVSDNSLKQFYCSDMTYSNGRFFLNGQEVKENAVENNSSSFGRTVIIGKGSFEDYKKKVDLGKNICEINGYLFINGKKADGPPEVKDDNTFAVPQLNEPSCQPQVAYPVYFHVENEQNMENRRILKKKNVV